MTKIYKRHCNYCGKYYEGYGKKFCNLSHSRKSRHNSVATEFRKGQIAWNKGKHHSEATKEKMRKNRADFSGSNHPNWKGGQYKYRNRWFIWKPNHPSVGKRPYILKSHLVAEKCLGRYLTPKEIIHHINKISDDDRPENLYLFPSISKHQSYHNLIRYHGLKNKLILISNLL